MVIDNVDCEVSDCSLAYIVETKQIKINTLYKIIMSALQKYLQSRVNLYIVLPQDLVH